LLLFRSEEHVDRWCAEHRTPRGAIVALDALWRLTVLWYADRLNEDWAPRTPAAIERLLAGAGLTGEFWRVR